MKRFLYLSLGSCLASVSLVLLWVFMGALPVDGMVETVVKFTIFFLMLSSLITWITFSDAKDRKTESNKISDSIARMKEISQSYYKKLRVDQSELNKITLAHVYHSDDDEFLESILIATYKKMKNRGHYVDLKYRKNED